MEPKLIIDYMKGILCRDVVFSIDRDAFNAGVDASQRLPGAGGVLQLCERVRPPKESPAIVPVPDGSAIVHVPDRGKFKDLVFCKVVNTRPENRHIQHTAGSTASSAFIMCNKLVDCFVLNDGGISFCSQDVTPVKLRLDSMAAANVVQCLSTLTIWQVPIGNYLWCSIKLILTM